MEIPFPVFETTYLYSISFKPFCSFQVLELVECFQASERLKLDNPFPVVPYTVQIGEKIRLTFSKLVWETLHHCQTQCQGQNVMNSLLI